MDVSRSLRFYQFYPQWLMEQHAKEDFIRGHWIGTVVMYKVYQIKLLAAIWFFYYWRAHSGLPCDYRTLKCSSWDYLALTISCGMIRYLKTDRTDPTKDPKEVIDQFLDVVCNIECSNTYLEYRMHSVSYWSLVLALGSNWVLFNAI